MCALTQELFQYSVITSTADELTMQPVCLNDLLEQSLAGFYGALTERGITPEIGASSCSEAGCRCHTEGTG